VRELTAARLVFAAALLWMTCVAFAVSGHAQAAQTIWSGVYSEAQAYRGEKVADKSCVGCHGPRLDGGDSGPKLVGPTFLANWSSQPVSELFDWVVESMPADAAGTLSKADAADVLAYILQLNKMPAGRADLPGEHNALSRIEFVAEKP